MNTKKQLKADVPSTPKPAARTGSTLDPLDQRISELTLTKGQEPTAEELPGLKRAWRLVMDMAVKAQTHGSRGAVDAFDQVCCMLESRIDALQPRTQAEVHT